MTWTWALAVASIVGVVLNIHKRRVCFVVWLCTNVTWAVVDFAHGLPAQAALFAVYAALAAWGWWAWKPERRRGRVCQGCMHLRASADVSARPRNVGTVALDAEVSP